MFASLAIVLSLLSPLLSGVADGCPDYQIIGARGSGQAGYGTQVGGVVDDVEGTLIGAGYNVESIALDYPAISLVDSFGLALFTGEYDASVDKGVAALSARLDTAANVCPGTGIILVGYSQGAQVIKRTMAERPPVDRIVSVVLLGDPTRDILQSGLVRLGAPFIESEGSLGGFPIPDQIRPLTVDVCAVDDSVCSNAGLNFSGHIDGYNDAYDSIGPYVEARFAEFAPRYRRYL